MNELHEAAGSVAAAVAAAASAIAAAAADNVFAAAAACLTSAGAVGIGDAGQHHAGCDAGGEGGPSASVSPSNFCRGTLQKFQNIQV